MYVGDRVATLRLCRVESLTVELALSQSYRRLTRCLEIYSALGTIYPRVLLDNAKQR